jgi:hypothetical protein
MTGSESVSKNAVKIINKYVSVRNGVEDG